MGATGVCRRSGRWFSVLFVAFFSLTPANLLADTHPRIWLNGTLLFSLKAKAAAGDADWSQLKAYADKLLSQQMPRFTVTGATNSNPVQFTVAEGIPWSGSTPVFIAGATGSWAPVNANGGDRPSAIAATRVSANTFSVPIDSTSFGSFAGQRIVLFFSEGGYSGYGYQGLDWHAMLQGLGIAYQVTGNAAYASKGIELLDYMASLGVAGMMAPEAIDSGFPSRSTILALALGYDWLYDRMTAQQRSAVVQALNVWFDWFKRAAFENNGPAYGNYFGGHIMGFGLAALATGSDNPRGAELAAYIRGLFDKYVPTAFTTGGFAGGYPVEVYTYGTNHFQRLLLYMLGVKTATGEDIFVGTDYARKMARSLVYNLKPNRWQVSDEGDYSGDYTGVLQPSFPLLLSHLLAGSQEGAWMQHLYQNLAPAPGQVTDSFMRFLFFDRLRVSTDYRLTQPTWYRSAGDEHFYRRSSWQDDAVWASFMGGTKVWAGHQMRAAGHVSIQRGNDYLLVNSGQWKGTSGYTGSPSSFDLRSWRANTLFLDDQGDYLWTGADYLGGQGYWGSNNVLAGDGGADFGYMKADLTSAYTVGDYKPLDSRSLRYFHRNFMSLGNGVVILFDRMQFLKGTYNKKLYFHLNPAGTPIVSANTISSKVGSSVLFIKPLLPASPRITATTDPVSATDTRPITNRIEISDPSSNTTINALTVLVAAASTTSTMPQTDQIQTGGGNMVGAMVLDGDTRRVALFATDGAPQATVSYSASYPSSQKGSHVLADLAPNTAYEIRLNGGLITTVTASPQGVVSFQTTGGGSFEVRSTGAVGPTPPPPGPTPGPSPPPTSGPQAPRNLRIVSSTVASAGPIITTFTSSPTTLTSAGTVTLSWQVSGATSLSIDRGIGIVTGSSRTVSVSATTVFTLTATNASGTATASTAVVVGQNGSTSGGRFVNLAAPVGGETFTAPASLRLVAAARDPNVYNNSPRDGLGGNASKVQFFVDDGLVLEVDGSQAEFWVFKGFAQNIAAGSHRVWARAIYVNPALVLDSKPVIITVNAQPTYARTVNLTSDLTVTNGYSLVGSAGGRVRVNGNGYRLVSGGSGVSSVTFQYVDFFDLGDRGTTTTTTGLDITVSSGLILENCVFDSSKTIQFALTGSAGATVRNNTFRSNMRQPLGQNPGADGTAGASAPALVFKGMASGSKTFQGNNVGAGWVLFETTQKWLVGGDNAADSNVLIGPRVGIYADRSSDIQIRRNYSHHIYYGGWSQGSNLELGGVSTVLAEHNVLAGSSWPVRGVAGEFRYNLILEAGHEWLWADHNGANVHHNVFVGGDNDIGGMLVLYNVTNVRIANNTVDGLSSPVASGAVHMYNGNVSLTSNIFINFLKTPIAIDSGTLSANYNLFWNSAAPLYSDSRRPANDVTADPQLTNPCTKSIEFDEALVWTRALGVRDITGQYRSRYTPRAGSPALSGGDPSAGSAIGAIGGAAATDLFGK